jgi:replication factor C subunit 2/4
MQPKKLGSSYEAVSAVVTDIVADGWSAGQLVLQVSSFASPLAQGPVQLHIPRDFLLLVVKDANHRQLYRRMVYNDAIPDIQKNKIVTAFSEMDKRLVDGADEHLSILDLALRISGILGGS